MYEEINEPQIVNAPNNPDDESGVYEPESKFQAYNTNKQSDKKIFFTSTHISMVERSPKNNERKAMTLPKNSAVANNLSNRMKNLNSAANDRKQSMDDNNYNNWMKSDENFTASNKNVMLKEGPLILIHRNSQQMGIDTKINDKKSTDRAKNTSSNSNTDIRSKIKRLKITSQIE